MDFSRPRRSIRHFIYLLYRADARAFTEAIIPRKEQLNGESTLLYSAHFNMVDAFVPYVFNARWVSPFRDFRKRHPEMGKKYGQLAESERVHPRAQ